MLSIVLFPFSFFSFLFYFLFFSDDRGIASDRKLTKPGQSGSDEGNFCTAMLNLLFTTTTKKNTFDGHMISKTRYFISLILTKGKLHKGCLSTMKFNFPSNHR